MLKVLNAAPVVALFGALLSLASCERADPDEVSRLGEVIVSNGCGEPVRVGIRTLEDVEQERLPETVRLLPEEPVAFTEFDYSIPGFELWVLLDGESARGVSHFVDFADFGEIDPDLGVQGSLTLRDALCPKAG